MERLVCHTDSYEAGSTFDQISAATIAATSTPALPASVCWKMCSGAEMLLRQGVAWTRSRTRFVAIGGHLWMRRRDWATTSLQPRNPPCPAAEIYRPEKAAGLYS